MRKGRSLAGPPFGLGARRSYWQATAVLSGPGPTVPLVLAVNVLPVLVNVASEPHAMPMP